jgi:hypothetical protein
MLLLFAVARAACPGGPDTASFARNLVEAEGAYSAGDIASFESSFLSAHATLPCMGGVVPRPVAATWHRVAALRALTRDDQAGAVGEFRAVLAIDPQWEISAEIAPPGNPNREAFDAARLAGPGGSLPARARARTSLMVDGEAATSIPADRPYLLQSVDPDGVVRGTWLQFAGTRLPAEAEQPRSRSALALSAGAAAVGAAGLYGLAWSLRGDFDDPATDYAALDGLETGTNASVVGAVGLGAVALGLGAAAVVVQW